MAKWCGRLARLHVLSDNRSNKAVQTDNLRRVCLVVSLSLHFTTRQTAHELRLTAALDSEIEKHWFICFVYVRQVQLMQSS